MTDDNFKISWDIINANLNRLTPVIGGYSQAHTGLLVLPNGLQIFVKLGTEHRTKNWAKKDIAVYRFLKKQSFKHTPELLAVNPSETAYALEALTAGDGWDWTDNWNKDRLSSTLAAMDDLAAIKPVGIDLKFFNQKAISEADDGWRIFAKNLTLQKNLRDSLRAINETKIAGTLDFSELAGRSAKFKFSNDVLVHVDIRADNCAWNAKTNQVSLVDWSWAELGDPRIDNAALLTHVQSAGYNVMSDYSSRLSADALQWLAGFWFKSALRPVGPGGPVRLRESQLLSGITALKIAEKL